MILHEEPRDTRLGRELGLVRLLLHHGHGGGGHLGQNRFRVCTRERRCKIYLLGRLCAGPLPLLRSVFIVRILQLVEVPQVLRLLPERGLLLISQRLPDLAEILWGVKYLNEKNIYTPIIILAGIRRGCISVLLLRMREMFLL